MKDKTRETRLRRMAKRQGLALFKSRRRDPLASDYGLWWIADPEATRGANDPEWPFPGRPAFHAPHRPVGLEEVEDFLTDADRAAAARDAA
jgi:hypothetical protein